MKKYTPTQLIRLLAAPLLTILPGLVLLFSPDTASSLIGQLLAWCCLLTAAVLAAGVFFGAPAVRNKRTAAALVLGIAGIWMLRNPLFMAKILGRILGLFLLLRGLRIIREHLPPKGSRPAFSPALGAAAGVTALGIVLILVPLSASRAAFSILGVVLIGIGVADGIDRLRSRELLDEGQDPNIIDVEKL